MPVVKAPMLSLLHTDLLARQLADRLRWVGLVGAGAAVGVGFLSVGC